MTGFREMGYSKFLNYDFLCLNLHCLETHSKNCPKSYQVYNPCGSDANSSLGSKIKYDARLRDRELGQRQKKKKSL